MPDPFYPSIDIGFITEELEKTGKFQGHLVVGSTTTFILKGPQAIHKRTILIRPLDNGEVCYEQASGLAARFRFMHNLLEWLDENRAWKEGAYIIKETNKV